MYRILELNPQLQHFSGDIDLRMARYHETKSRILGKGMTLKDFANAHHYFGIHHLEKGVPHSPKGCSCVVCRQ